MDAVATPVASAQRENQSAADTALALCALPLGARSFRGITGQLATALAILLCLSSCGRNEKGAVPIDNKTPSVVADEFEQPPGIGCADNGCIAELFSFGTYTANDLRGIIGNATTIENGYEVWRLRFVSSGRLAGASVTLPIAGEKPAAGWPVVINNPGTVGLADACALGSSVAGTALAATFGVRGAISVVLDYPGLGTPGTHPYLVADVAGRASLDAARAVIALANYRQTTTSGRIAFVGISQGGHATLAVANQYSGYAPELDVRALAVVAPATMWQEHWANGLEAAGPHVAYYALLVYSWLLHYGHDGENPWASAVRPIVDGVMSKACLVASENTAMISDLLGDDPAELFTENLILAFRTGNFSRYPGLASGFAANRITQLKHDAPLLVYQGLQDDTVLPVHSEELVDSLRASGADVDYRRVPFGGHTDIALGFVGVSQLRGEEAISWVLKRLR